MATPAEVIDLLADVREGSRLDRARTAATAFGAFATLSPTEKRDLAVLVAQRAAPHLVPRIEAETGLDLTREQIQAVLDMAGRMDARDLDALRLTVRDDDVVPAPEPPQPPERPAPPEPPEAAESAPDPDPDPEPTVEVTPTPTPSPRPFVSIFDRLPDTPAWDVPAAGAVEPRPAPLATDAGDATGRVRAARHPLLERLRTAATNAARLRLLRRDLDTLGAMDRAGRLAVVEALPDGWARRRAMETMLVAGVLPADEVPDLLGRVASPTSRAWLCASAIEADLLRLEDVAGLVDERATDRLRRRYG